MREATAAKLPLTATSARRASCVNSPPPSTLVESICVWVGSPTSRIVSELSTTETTKARSPLTATFRTPGVQALPAKNPVTVDLPLTGQRGRYIRDLCGQSRPSFSAGSSYQPTMIRSVTGSAPGCRFTGMIGPGSAAGLTTTFLAWVERRASMS